MLGKKIPKYKCLAVLKARSSTLAPKRKRENFPGLLQDWHLTCVISPTASNLVVLTCSCAPQAPLPCCLSLLSSQSQVSLSLWVPSIVPSAFHLARQPEMLPHCWLAEASGIKREQSRVAILSTHLSYSFFQKGLGYSIPQFL